MHTVKRNNYTDSKTPADRLQTDRETDANAHVDYERVIPELCIGDTSSGRGSDAIMDVVATFPNATRQYGIDVTVRSPHADRNNTTAGTNASNTFGLAASGDCKEQWDRTLRASRI